jgi:hypothetical protein
MSFRISTDLAVLKIQDSLTKHNNVVPSTFHLLVNTTEPVLLFVPAYEYAVLLQELFFQSPVMHL